MEYFFPPTSLYNCVYKMPLKKIPRSADIGVLVIHHSVRSASCSIIYSFILLTLKCGNISSFLFLFFSFHEKNLSSLESQLKTHCANYILTLDLKWWVIHRFPLGLY